MTDRILLIRTGGTIDAEPYSDPKQPPQYVSTLKSADSLIMPTVAESPNHQNVDGFSWGTWQEEQFVKDSQLFTADDMRELAALTKQDDHRCFVITHGTDAMVKNAKMLEAALADTDKTVVFAGAMVPLSMREEHGSDGVEALHFALGGIDGLAAGVHITGRDTHTKRLAFFDPETVEKDREASAQSLSFTLKPTEPQRG